MVTNASNSPSSRPHSQRMLSWRSIVGCVAVGVIAALVGAVGSAALAEQDRPATTPADSRPVDSPEFSSNPTTGAEQNAGEGNAADRHRRPGAGAAVPARGLGEFWNGDYRRVFDGNPTPPTTEEWTEIAEFAKTNLPNRWKMLEEIIAKRGPDAPVVKSIKQRLANRYRVLQRAQSDNPQFYHAAMQQVRQEDEAWEAVRQHKAKPDDAALRAAMREKVQALMSAILEERTQRLESMRRYLDMEESRIAYDRENVDQLVDQHMTLMMAEPGETPRPGRFGPGGMGPGGGDRGDRNDRGDRGDRGERRRNFDRDRNDTGGGGGGGGGGN